METSSARQRGAGAASRAGLAAFLRARRARVTPEDAGLPGTPRRRTPGLRRQEVAQLAGMSIDYYIRLEQGRGPQPSRQVLSALARALMLTTDERDYLFRMAGQAPLQPARPSREVTPGIRHLLDSMPTTPAYVVDAAYNILAWNPLATNFIGDLEGHTDRNMIRWTFRRSPAESIWSDEAHLRFTRATVADLRAGYARYPGDRETESLVTEMLALSPQFAEMWSAHEVEVRGPMLKRVDHPDAGLLEFECQLLHIAETGQRLIVYCAAPGSATEAAFLRLAADAPPRMSHPDPRPRHPGMRTVVPGDKGAGAGSAAGTSPDIQAGQVTASAGDVRLAQAFEEQRPRLVRLAYATLGSLADAEDCVQEAWLRLQRAQERGEIRDVAAWLTTTVSRLALDVLGSARARREQYVGEWLPEPIVEDIDAADPADRVSLDESVSMALLVVLERLSAAERTAFLLHDVFSLSFDEVATVVGRSPAAVRQLASRARRHVESGRPKLPPTHAEQREVVTAFAAACQAGDLERLVALLDPDVTWRGDGGGKVPTFPLKRGAGNVARTMVTVLQNPPIAIRMALVNGAPGLVLRDAYGFLTVIAFTVDAGKITAIDSVRNPEKLTTVPLPD